MSNMILIEPSTDFKSQYIEMIEEWKGTGERMVPFVLRYDYEDFDSFLDKIKNLRDNPMQDEKTVNSSTFWLLENDERIVGVVNIRHRLNRYLLEIGGHIGYGIRPSSRRQGYATVILNQSLRHARSLGITRALVTCDKDNIASARTIIKNNGILDSEATINGVEIQRYWIEIR